MGRAKEEMMRYEQEKWSPIDDKLLCRKCLETAHDFLEFFSNKSRSDECDYCQKKKKVVEINELLEFIADAIHSEYEDPVHSLPYESAEGGYYGAKIYDTVELFFNLISFNKEEVFDDVVSAFDPFAAWCQREPFQDRKSDLLNLNWAKFSEIIKYERRYFFPRPRKENGVRNFNVRRPKNAGEILNVIFRIAGDLNIFTHLKKGTEIFRARAVPNSQSVGRTIEEMGVPPREISIKSANRLSPAGIPIFYGGLSTGHLAKEIRLKANERLAVGKFVTTKDICILDLTRIPLPSIFSEVDPRKRETIKFLNTFRREIMHPVEHDGSEHVEYVPSQVFSEFVRHYCEHKGKGVLGIKYPSAFSRSDNNIALFVSNEAIDETNKPKKGAVLRFSGMA